MKTIKVYQSNDRYVLISADGGLHIFSLEGLKWSLKNYGFSGAELKGIIQDVQTVSGSLTIFLKVG